MEINKDNPVSRHLHELGGSEFEMVDDQPVITGWEVINSDNQRLGIVDELLFDENSRQVRYIILDTDGNDWDLKSRKVLIPIGLAELDEKTDKVIIPFITPQQLVALPDYLKDGVTQEMERLVGHAFHAVLPESSSETTDVAYEHSSFHVANLYNRRRSGFTKPHTVIGVFDNGFKAQVAIQRLKSNGFHENNIDVSTRSAENEEPDYLEKLKAFFDELIDNKEEASHYSKLAKEGSVVTVYTQSVSESEKALRLLDESGAADVEESTISDAHNTSSVDMSSVDTDEDSISERFRRQIRCRIIERQVESGKRLRDGI